ncbi:YdcF family protein [Microcoleus sp. FACHB-SPT15]|uniref:YdcF family protein n=1 Tax=Microcoleus sp. FACHB-SPT15 TaxID=2692830 RepID=UPI0028C39597|nr:YdcF family protein [Microcoleus sp. FACHB-SPT15]
MLRYPPKKRWLALTLLGLISMFFIVIGYSALSIYLYGSNTSKVPADAAIVLGAAAWGDKPSPVFRERINHGINLYKRNDIQRLIFTGGQGESSEPSEAIVAKRYAIAQGVDAEDILTETKSRTTRQNLYYASQVAATHQLRRILIVSDPLHMKRAVLMARDLDIDAYPSPTPTTRYRSFKSQMSFLARETYFYFVYQLFRI